MIPYALTSFPIEYFTSDFEIERFAKGPMVQKEAPAFTVSALMPNKEFKVNECE
jgi:hypothetical protein